MQKIAKRDRHQLPRPMSHYLENRWFVKSIAMFGFQAGPFSVVVELTSILLCG